MSMYERMKIEAKVQVASHNFAAYIQWRHYVKTCFENGCFPITYNDTVSLSISQANGPSWTNVIRSDVIYKYYESSNAISANDVSKFGYITKHGNVTFLSFTKNSYNNKRYLLQSPTKPDDISTLPTTHSTSFSEATGVHKTSAFPIYNNTFMNSRDSTVKNGIFSPDSYDVSIPMSVSVTVVILVAVTVIVILILRKRGKIPSTGLKCSALGICLRRTPDQFPSETNSAYENFQQAGNERIGELNYYMNVDARQDLHLDNINTYCSIDPAAKETDTYDILDPKKT
ncbi:uncharacterized protein LOC132738837 [Ruditapes philippinarum]|uniref:uncharacterized protein LOC132738837 n=1 Tax=Ruditapes philippinarum TaxID=129788 RepID=UPI00295C10D3|nr:uncharacterized protein LOC132738837 [Ruditapes philippinarum]